MVSIVTAFSSWKYCCDKCGKTFNPPEFPQTAYQYGHGLANWVVYQNVALDQNISKVQRCLREVFKLDVPQPTVHRFKASLWARGDEGGTFVTSVSFVSPDGVSGGSDGHAEPPSTCTGNSRSCPSA